jgi:hypothetical protein
MSVVTQIQVRRGTASQWTSADTVLSSGEWGFETDTGKVKIGDGTTAWTALGYTGAGDVTLTGTQTLTNKTLTTPKITLTYSAKIDNYTFADGDQGNVFSMNAATAKEFRIPTDATFNFGIGTQFNVFWITGAGQPKIVAVTPGTTAVISTGATSASPNLRIANSMASCLKIAANSWIVLGDIA